MDHRTALHTLRKREPSRMPTATLTEAQRALRRWLGVHVSLLALFDDELRHSVSEQFVEEERLVYGALTRVTAELNRRRMPKTMH